MSDTERGRKPYHGRRNAPCSRPPPGVQKAINNFGVRDLREILNKKQEESPKDTKKKLPPPDPSYNYLKDPARDRPTSPPCRKEPKKQPQQLYRTPKALNRSKTDPNIKNYGPQPANDTSETVSKKKELRSSDTAKSLVGEQQIRRGGWQGNFRSRAHEGFGTIENPVNIKIKLSTETGQRSYVLDESTKIADIKHVPDNSPSASRGLPRGGSRGKGRGRRGSFRGWGRRPFRGRGGFHVKNNLAADQKTGEDDNKHEEILESNEFSSEYDEKKTEAVAEGDNESHQDGSEFDPSLAETVTIVPSNCDSTRA